MTKKRAGAIAMAATLSAILLGSGAEFTQAANAMVTQSLIDRFTIRWDVEGSSIRREIVESPTAPGGAALEVRMRRAIDEVWRSRVTVPLTEDINAGDEVELRIWIRAEDPINGLETGNIDLQIVRTSEPYDNIFSENIRPTGDGQYYVVSGVAQADFDADDVVFGANMGYGRQTIHFGPIFVNRVAAEE